MNATALQPYSKQDNRIRRLANSFSDATSWWVAWTATPEWGVHESGAQWNCTRLVLADVILCERLIATSPWFMCHYYIFGSFLYVYATSGPIQLKYVQDPVYSRYNALQASRRRNRAQKGYGGAVGSAYPFLQHAMSHKIQREQNRGTFSRCVSIRCTLWILMLIYDVRFSLFRYTSTRSQLVRLLPGYSVAIILFRQFWRNVFLNCFVARL